jgi:hypothetical protein
MGYRLGNVRPYSFGHGNVSIAGFNVAFPYESLASSIECEGAPRVNLKHSVEIGYGMLVFFFFNEEEPAIIEGGHVVRFKSDRTVVIRQA